MTLAAPTRVKGIDPRTREIAEDHARRSGLTLREWLGQVIVQDSAHSEPEPLDREIEAREGSRVEAAEQRAMLAIGSMAPSLAAALEKSECAQRAAAARFEGMVDALCNAETHASNTVSDLHNERGQAHQGPGQLAGDQAAEAVERRPSSAIERLGGEVARIIEVVDLRLARNDVAAAQDRAKLRTEVAQIVEQLTERIANAERRSPLPDVGDQAHGAGERALYGREEGSSNLAEDLRQGEERQAALLQDERERALGLPELRRVVAEAGWFSPCPSRSLDPGLTAPSFAPRSSAATDDDLFFDPEVGLLVPQPANAADCASFALWADEPFGPESSWANAAYASEPTALDTTAFGDVFAETAPGPQASVSTERVAKVDRRSAPGLGAGSIFGWLGSSRKEATRRGPSKLQAALIVSAGAAVVGMAVAGSAILVSTPGGAVPERVAGALGQSPVQPLRLRAGETAAPFAALALSPKPLP